METDTDRLMRRALTIEIDVSATRELVLSSYFLRAEFQPILSLLVIDSQDFYPTANIMLKDCTDKKWSIGFLPMEW